MDNGLDVKGLGSLDSLYVTDSQQLFTEVAVTNVHIYQVANKEEKRTRFIESGESDVKNWSQMLLNVQYNN